MLPMLGLLGEQLSSANTGKAGLPVLSQAAAFSFDQLPKQTSPNGNISRAVIQGKLPTGEIIEMHETTLQPNQMPHAAHKHLHTEFMLIREGTVEFSTNGVPHQLGPGGVGYAASNQMHGIKNVGTTPANYFVIAIGAE